MGVNADVMAADIVAGYNRQHGVCVGVNSSEVQSKLSELMNKLLAMGFDWSFVMRLVALLLPMIMSGKFDWDAVWAFIQTLIVPTPGPTPAPGPVTT